MRKRRAKERPIKPDSRYGDELVSRFVNHMTWEGKKALAYRLFYDAMDVVKEKMKSEDELEVWKKALNNVMPQVEVRSRRIGGATFQIPTEVRPARKVSIGIKWMIKYARLRSGKGFANKLAAEIIAASKNEGAAVKKKEDTHRMAEANKAFAHFRV